MSNRLSVLQNATRADVRQTPYPHLVVRNALDEDIYKELEASFPGYDFFVPKDTPVADRKYLMRGLDALDSGDAIAPVWKEFIEYHISKQFFTEVVELFEPEIKELYPRLEQVLGKPLKECSTGLRWKGLVPNMSNEHDFMLDCQPYIDCTFTDRPMRGPHVDAPEELYAALLYMRSPEDDSTGGGLDVRKPIDEETAFPSEQTVAYPIRTGFSVDQSDLVARVPYERNTVVLFINSWKSLHAVETRNPHVLPRRAINIIGEIARYDQKGLFTVVSPNAPAPKKLGVVKTVVDRVRRKLK